MGGDLDAKIMGGNTFSVSAVDGTSTDMVTIRIVADDIVEGTEDFTVVGDPSGTLDMMYPGQITIQPLAIEIDDSNDGTSIATS